ncbi:MAG TPA: oxidoreductase, partial [Afipia sp.]|nr:oxidoreductase [Afipia sp.]
MPLVKGNAIVTDEFVHLADDAELPAGGAVLVSAERFLADPEKALSRKDKTGVIWPNNRDVDDLLPYLGRLAAGA